MNQGWSGADLAAQVWLGITFLVIGLTGLAAIWGAVRRRKK